jgi:hypothetical protein
MALKFVDEPVADSEPFSVAPAPKPLTIERPLTPPTMVEKARWAFGTVFGLDFIKPARQDLEFKPKFQDFTLAERRMFQGAAQTAVTASSIFDRGVGKDERANAHRRAINTIGAINSELDKGSVFGKRVGPIVGSVVSDLLTFSQEAFAGPKAAATMFGARGYDTAMEQGKDLPKEQRERSAMRQFFIDAGTYWAGYKVMQKIGAESAKNIIPGFTQYADEFAKQSGLRRAAVSALANGGENATNTFLTLAEQAYSDRDPEALSNPWKVLATVSGSAAVGAAASAVPVGFAEAGKLWDTWREKAAPILTYDATAQTRQVLEREVTAIDKQLSATPKKLRANQPPPPSRDVLLAQKKELETELGHVREAENVALDSVKELKQTKVEQELIASVRGRAAKRADKAATNHAQVIKKAAEHKMAEAGGGGQGDASRAFSMQDFEASMIRARQAVAVEEPKVAPVKVDPNLKAPWEPRTHTEARLETTHARLEDARLKIRDMRQATREQKALREDQLKSARELVQEYVPPEDQGRFLVGIEQARTPARVDKLLDRVIKHVDDADHRQAKTQLAESIKKAANLRDEFRDMAKQVRNSVEFKKFKNKEAAQQLKNLVDENPQALLTDTDKAMLGRLEKQDVNSMTADDIRTLSSFVQDLAYESATRDKLIGETFATQIRDVGDKITVESQNVKPLAMKGGPPEPQYGMQPETAAKMAEPTRIAISKGFREFGTRPEITIGRISPTLRDWLYKKIGLEDQDKLDLWGKEVTTQYSGLLNAIGLDHSSTIKAAALSKVGQPGTALDAWRDQKRTIGGVDLTRGEAGLIMRAFQDYRNIEPLRDFGYEFADGRRTGAIDDNMLMQLAEFFGKEGMSQASYMFQYTNGPMIDRVNDTHRVLKGRPLTERRDVVPRSVAEEDYTKLTRSSLAARAMAVDSYGHLQHRTEAGNALKQSRAGGDFIDEFFGHVDRMHKYAAFGVSARNAEAILNDPPVRQRITELNGKDGLEEIEDALRSHVAGYVAADFKDVTIARINSATAAAILGGRVSTMALQPVDMLTAAAYDQGGLARLTKNARLAGDPRVMKEMEAVLGAESGLYWRRFGSDKYSGETTSGAFRQRGHFRPQSLADHAMRPLAELERQVSSVFYVNAKDKVAEAGVQANMDDPQYRKAVALEWNQQVLRAFNSSNGLELSSALRRARQNPLFGLITSFSNTATKIYSLLPKAVDEFSAGRHEEGLHTLAALGTSIAATAAVRAAMSHEKSDDPYLTRFGKRFILGLVGVHPMFGQLLETVPRKMMGMREFSGDNVFLLGQLGGVAVQLGQTAKTWAEVNSSKKDLSDAFKETYDLVIEGAALLGIPADGLNDLAYRVWNNQMAPGLDPPVDKEKMRGVFQSL